MPKTKRIKRIEKIKKNKSEKEELRDDIVREVHVWYDIFPLVNWFRKKRR